MKKKVLIIANIIEHMIFHEETIKYFNSLGYEVHVAAKMSENKKNFEKYNIIFHNISFERSFISLNHFKAIKEIKSLAMKEEYEIIHVHTPIAAFLSRYALNQVGAKNIIYTAHGFHFYKGASILNWLVYYPIEKIAARWTDTLITINNEDFEIAKKLKLRKAGSVFKINGPGIDVRSKYSDNKIKNEIRDQYRKELNINEEDFIVLVLAEINKNKNHIQLIKAIEKIEYPNIKLVCAGKGPLQEEYEAYIKQKNLETKIIFLGWRNDVEELIISSDIVALVSKREGLGKCLLEAMNLEKPVLATNTRGPRELIEDGINGFKVEIGDIESTANKIDYLYRNKHKCEEFGRRGNLISKKYSSENVMESLKKIYCKYIY